MWIDNEDGTYTAEKGDILYSLYGDDWKEKSGYEGNPIKLQVGQVVGKEIITNIRAKGAGIGLFASCIAGEDGHEIDLSFYELNFTIENTGEQFSAKFKSLAFSGSGFKIGVGAYCVNIEAEGVFKGKIPTKEDIIKDFSSGESLSSGGGFLWVGITGTESGNWLIKTGSLGASIGAPFSFGLEKSVTGVRK